MPAVGIMATARLLGFLLVYVGSKLPVVSSPVHNTLAAAHPFAPGSTLRHLFQPFASWDGTWYIRIASQGYHRVASWAFFPLFPWLLHGTADATDGQYVIGGVLLSIVASLGAAALLYLLVEQDYGRRVALWAVAFLAFFPTSIFLQAVYTESLFLVTTLATVLLARRGRWALAGVAGLLAALTRNTGVLLLIPFLAFYGASINWHWRAIDRRALWAVLIPVGTAIYMAYQWALGGNPLLFNDVQSEVWRRHLANPIDSLFRGANYSLILLHNLLWHGTLPPAAIHNLVAFPILAIAIMALALAWRRLRISYLVYAAAAIVIPLSFPSPQKPLYSMARFLLACFPLFIALGVLLERRPRVRWAMLAIFIAGYAWLTIEFTRHVFIS